jgi:hypothetical protein
MSHRSAGSETFPVSFGGLPHASVCSRLPARGKGSTMNDCEYEVLAYGPLCTAEAAGVCMVIVRGPMLDASTSLAVYVPSENPGMLPQHWEYLLGLACDWQALSDGTDRLFESLQNLSTGPLRLEISGTCRQSQVHQILAAHFKDIAYEAAPRSRGCRGTFPGIKS